MAGLDAGVEAVLAALRAAGYAVLPSLPPDAPLACQISAAMASEAEIVFVAGGDGTLRAAAERLRGSGKLLAPLPGGTMNRICARIGLPADPVEAARSYAGAVPAALDLGQAGSAVFLYQCVVGEPARLTRFREMQRGQGWRGWLALLRAGARQIARPGRARLLVLMHGARRRARIVVITVPHITREAPAFEVELARAVGLLARVRQLWRWARGRLREDAGVSAHKACRLAVWGGDPLLRVTLDGEMRLLAPPLRCRHAAAALPILMPAPRP